MRHRGLRRLIERDDRAGVPAAHVSKLLNMIAFLQDMEHERELRTIPTWRAHRLSGDRRGTWSLFVSRNWRLTFSVDPTGVEIFGLDLEDYH